MSCTHRIGLCSAQVPCDGHLHARLADIRKAGHDHVHGYVLVSGRGSPHGAGGVRNPGAPVKLETRRLVSVPVTAAVSVTVCLQHLAVVGGGVLDRPSEDGCRQESAELLCGAQTLRESWTHGGHTVDMTTRLWMTLRLSERKAGHVNVRIHLGNFRKSATVSTNFRHVS